MMIITFSLDHQSWFWSDWLNLGCDHWSLHDNFWCSFWKSVGQNFHLFSRKDKLQTIEGQILRGMMYSVWAVNLGESIDKPFLQFGSPPKLRLGVGLLDNIRVSIRTHPSVCEFRVRHQCQGLCCEVKVGFFKWNILPSSLSISLGQNWKRFKNKTMV